MDTISIGSVNVTRLILGSNPFSGFAHQGPGMDREMRRYYTVETIKRTLREAEEAGINTIIARSDFHVIRMIEESRDEGGMLQWFAQTCPEVGNHEMCVTRAARGGAKACHIHGGVMDHLLAQGRLDEIPDVVAMIHDKGMLAGMAGHSPAVFEWAEAQHIDVDYYMCSYYNPVPRVANAEHVPSMTEQYLDEDRDSMIDLIGRLSKPVIHYKVLAAGRNDPAEAFATVAKHLRPNDAVCVGVFTRDHPDMVREDVDLFEAALAGRAETE